MNRMETIRERVAWALYDRQLAFEREHSQRVVHPIWGVAYRDYWGFLADAALAALGLDDIDAAAIRSIEAWAHEYANDDWRELSAEGQLAVARAVLEAACTATGEGDS